MFTLCGLLAVHQHPKAASRGADSDGASEEGPILDSWVLWTLTVSFGIGIAPSFPNVIGLANRLYPGSFSGVTQSFFGISANAGNGALPGIAGLLAGMTGIGDVSYLFVPFIGIIFMQILLWALIYVAPRSSEDEDGRRSGHSSQ